jgi:hypothetical protein
MLGGSGSGGIGDGFGAGLGGFGSGAGGSGPVGISGPGVGCGVMRCPIEHAADVILSLASPTVFACFDLGDTRGCLG